MLDRTNIIGLVGTGQNVKYPTTRVVIWDDITRQSIGEINFKSDVRGVKLRKDTIVVVLEQKMFLYDFQTLQVIEVI